MTDVDLSTAENAYLTLIDARLKPTAAAHLVRALRTKMKNSGNQSRELEIAQADAWLAICALSKSLDTDYETAPEKLDSRDQSHGRLAQSSELYPGCARHDGSELTR
jgi:hypothetical protein